MREIRIEEVTEAVKSMCIEANYELSQDMKEVFCQAVEREKSPLGKKVLGQLEENLRIASEDQIPICQDTGMAVVFIKVGQEVHFTGGSLEAAIHEGVRQGYKEGYLRKSVVGDPIERINGSENMSRIFMLKPADGLDGVKEAILTAVRDAGPNACPPMVVGVGIGGTFEKAAQMAKHALTRTIGTKPEIPWVQKLEDEMLTKINKLGIGPGGLGGSVTALAVHAETYPTHIAGLPVAVNICCHVNRHAHRVL